MSERNLFVRVTGRNKILFILFALIGFISNGEAHAEINPFCQWFLIQWKNTYVENIQISNLAEETNDHLRDYDSIEIRWTEKKKVEREWKPIKGAHLVRYRPQNIQSESLVVYPNIRNEFIVDVRGVFQGQTGQISMPLQIEKDLSNEGKIIAYSKGERVDLSDLLYIDLYWIDQTLRPYIRPKTEYEVRPQLTMVKANEIQREFRNEEDLVAQSFNGIKSVDVTEIRGISYEPKELKRFRKFKAVRDIQELKPGALFAFRKSEPLAVRGMPTRYEFGKILQLSAGGRFVVENEAGRVYTRTFEGGDLRTL